jgi:predicted MFS family arabinose efflux permease
MAKNQGASPSQIGIMSAFSGVGGVVGTLVAPRASKRLGPRAAIGTTFWAMAALLPLLILARGPFQLGAVFGAMFVAYPTWSALHGAYRAALVPDRLQGRVQSVSMLVFLGPIPFGVLLAGITLQTLGSTPTILILLGLMVTVATVAVTSSTIRNAPTLEEAAQRSRLEDDEVLEVREPAPLA